MNFLRKFLITFAIFFQQLFRFDFPYTLPKVLLRILPEVHLKIRSEEFLQILNFSWIFSENSVAFSSQYSSVRLPRNRLDVHARIPPEISPRVLKIVHKIPPVLFFKNFCRNSFGSFFQKFFGKFLQDFFQKFLW